MTDAQTEATVGNHFDGTAMKDKKITEESDYPTPQGMQGWLEREIADIMKATELRIKDATKFVNAYARGEITADEAAKRNYQYSERWGEALPGILRSKGLSDEEILKRIDQVREPGFVRRLASENLGTGRKKPGGP